MNCIIYLRFGQDMGEHNELGKEGERLAVEFLETKDYFILHRNYRYRKAEIDIIAKKGSVLAIVEVKYRSSSFFDNIAESVTKKKIKLLVSAADHYVTENDLDVGVRFDIITILKTKDLPIIEHIEDAFYHF